MCGRFAQYTPPAEIASQFQVDPQHVLVLDWQPRYNIAPSEHALVVTLGDDRERTLGSMKWGFLPHWAKDLQDGPHPFNARAETVDAKPFFRSAFGTHRCLIPCDGFYEWQSTESGKQPHFITLRKEAPLLWPDFGITGKGKTGKSTPSRSW